MRPFHAWFLVIVGVLTSPETGHAQPIYQLTACTRSVTNDPSTTARLLDINVQTGAATNPRETGVYGLAGIAQHSATGALFGLTTVVSVPSPNSLLTLDVSSGSASLIGPTGMTTIVEGDIAYSPADGQFYGIQEGTASITHRYLFRMSPTTGAATLVGDLPFPGDYSALAFSPNGSLYTVRASGTTPDVLMRIDPANGVVLSTQSMNIRLGSSAGLAIHPTTGIAYIAGGLDFNPNLGFYQLDLTTGTTTELGTMNLPYGISGLTFVAIPEPSAVICMTTALLLTAAKASRNRTRQRTAGDPT